MPIGKDSITKRVINAAEPAPETELPGRTPKKAPAKRKTAPKPAAEPVKAPEAEKPVETPAPVEAPKPVEAAPAEPTTTVMGNVSPEVVEKVTGHPEGEGEKHVSVTDPMPVYLL